MHSQGANQGAHEGAYKGTHNKGTEQGCGDENAKRVYNAPQRCARHSSVPPLSLGCVGCFRNLLVVA